MYTQHHTHNTTTVRWDAVDKQGITDIVDVCLSSAVQWLRAMVYRQCPVEHDLQRSITANGKHVCVLAIWGHPSGPPLLGVPAQCDPDILRVVMRRVHPSCILLSSLEVKVACCAKSLLERCWICTVQAHMTYIA